MSATVYFTTNYENEPLRSLQQNKANQTQFVFFTADSADQTQLVLDNAIRIWARAGTDFSYRIKERQASRIPAVRKKIMCRQDYCSPKNSAKWLVSRKKRLL